MSERIKLKDIADAAGVSESTASRALAGSGQLSVLTRNKIVEAADRLGYNTPRGRLKRNQTGLRDHRGLVGVVVAALHNSFFPYLVDQLNNDLDDLGFDMVLIIDEITQDRASRKLRRLIDTLDGVILTTALIGSPMVEFLKDRKKPTVLAIRSNMQNDVHVAESDNFSAGVEALRHLVSLGHKRIGFLMGPESTSTSMGRLKGAKSVLDESDIQFDETLLFHTEFTHEGGYSSCLQLLRLPLPPSALFCANDVIAIGALEAARKQGYRIPQDISIIGVDDIPMASWDMISLTTVRQPIVEIGSMAAKLISETIRINKFSSPRNYIFPTSLIVRSTSGVADADGSRLKN
ncbi:MAG: LacI family DNA-binding transcriptional regulator [Aestuariivita sp.]|nr:LacI family DNA-binding transcriptional regulator [Aestuariivita sp.]